MGEAEGIVCVWDPAQKERNSKGRAFDCTEAVLTDGRCDTRVMA